MLLVTQFLFFLVAIIGFAISTAVASCSVAYEASADTLDSVVVIVAVVVVVVVVVVDHVATGGSATVVVAIVYEASVVAVIAVAVANDK